VHVKKHDCNHTEFFKNSLLISSIVLWLVLTAILDDSQLNKSVTFMSLKPRMTELLLRFLRAETDATNTQMLLGNCCFVLSLSCVWAVTAKL